ncbi:MAG: GNAT family N-acetyltransferase [Acidobacteriia bacterium]|nr:GNAT family N-acetyltransferase [Terriglobia bacterium]
MVGGSGVLVVPWLGSPTDPAPRRAWILNVYTEPEFRRRGIAHRPMDTAVAWCRAAGFRTVSLHASSEGPVARLPMPAAIQWTGGFPPCIEPP